MKTLYAIGNRLFHTGIGRIAGYAALGLSRNNLLSEVVCLGHESSEIPESLHRDIKFVPRGALPFLPDKPYYLGKNKWFDFRCRSRIRSGIDTFHCWNSQASGALEKAASRGVLTVVDRASSHIRTQSEILVAAYQRHGIRYEPTYESVIRRCEREYEIADVVVVPSQFVVDSFAERGFDMSKIVLNPFGVDADRFRPAKQPPDRFRAIFVGQVGVRKGAPELLQAFSRLNIPDAQLMLVGPEEVASTEALAPYRNHTDIIFAGSRSDVPELLAQSSVFVFPSWEEGSALVTYEAMAAGLPCIVTPNAGSHVVDGETGFVVTLGDIDALADRIAWCANNRDAAYAMGQKARKAIRPFTWDAYGKRTAQLHEKLTSR